MEYDISEFVQCPVGKNTKGAWKMLRENMDKELQDEIDKYNAWSIRGLQKGEEYISWPTIGLLPKDTRDKILELNPGNRVIVTGFHFPHYLIVFDVDDIDMVEPFRNACFEVFGPTYTRTSEKGKLHIYYVNSICEPIYNDNKTVYLDKHITINDIPLDVEIKQGALVKYIGQGRHTRDDLPVRQVWMEREHMEKIYSIIRGKLGCWAEIKSFHATSNNPSARYNDKSIPLDDSILNEVCWDMIYPRWISPELNKKREHALLAINGAMKYNGFTNQDVEYIIKWINKYAEPNNPAGAQVRNVSTAYNNKKKMAGIPTLLKYGFDELVDWISNNATGEIVIEKKVINKYTNKKWIRLGAKAYTNKRGINNG